MVDFLAYVISPKAIYPLFRFPASRLDHDGRHRKQVRRRCLLRDLPLFSTMATLLMPFSFCIRRRFAQ